MKNQSLYFIVKDSFRDCAGLAPCIRVVVPRRDGAVFANALRATEHRAIWGVEEIRLAFQTSLEYYRPATLNEIEDRCFAKLHRSFASWLNLLSNGQKNEYASRIAETLAPFAERDAARPEIEAEATLV